MKKGEHKIPFVGVDYATGKVTTHIILCGLDADGRYIQEEFEVGPEGGFFESRYVYREPKVLLPADVDARQCTFSVGVDDDDRG